MCNYITYLLLRLKNYLKLTISYLNSPQGEEVPYQALARAIDDKKCFDIKKLIKKGYSNFLAITLISPSVISTCQSIVSPGSTPNTLTISLGRPTFIDLVRGFA